MTSQDEHHDPVVKDILNQVTPPAHGSDFWSNLDGALASEPAPQDNVVTDDPSIIVWDAEPGQPASQPVSMQSSPVQPVPIRAADAPEPDLLMAAETAEANGQPSTVTSGSNSTSGSHSNSASTVTSLDSRRNRSRSVLALAAAAMVVLGFAGFMATRSGTEVSDEAAQVGDNSEQIDSSGVPEPADEPDGEEGPTGQPNLSANTDNVYSVVGLQTLDNMGAYSVRSNSKDLLPCSTQGLVVRTNGEYSADLAEFKADQLDVLRSNDGRLAVIEHCGSDIDINALTLRRIYVGNEAPGGGFEGEPTVVDLVGAPSEFLMASWGHGAITNGVFALNLDTGRMISAVECSGVAVRSLPGPADQELELAVQETRSALQVAANLCDWEALGALMGPDFEGDADTLLAEWQELEQSGASGAVRPMGQLSGALNTPAALILDPTDGSTDQLWSWPRAVIFSCADMPLSAQNELFDELNYSARQLDEDCAAIGAYAGWRVALDLDGEWRYFKKS